MSNPQQPEIARSRKTPAQDPDSVAGVLEAQDQPGVGGPAGPIPADNQPGHHPAKEQDKPDLDAFAARLGVVEGDGDAPGNGAASNGPVATATEAVRGKGRTVAVALAVLTTVLAVLGVVITRKRRGGRR